MRFEIEEEDCEAIKAIANDYYGVVLSLEQAEDLIKDHIEDLAPELSYGLDTVGREVFGKILVKVVMGDTRPTITDTFMDGNVWHWPYYGSPDEYSQEFYKVFKSKALERGYEFKPDK